MARSPRTLTLSSAVSVPLVGQARGQSTELPAGTQLTDYDSRTRSYLVNGDPNRRVSRRQIDQRIGRLAGSWHTFETAAQARARQGLPAGPARGRRAPRIRQLPFRGPGGVWHEVTIPDADLDLAVSYIAGNFPETYPVWVLGYGYPSEYYPEDPEEVNAFGRNIGPRKVWRTILPLTLARTAWETYPDYPWDFSTLVTIERVVARWAE